MKPDSFSLSPFLRGALRSLAAHRRSRTRLAAAAAALLLFAFLLSGLFARRPAKGDHVVERGTLEPAVPLVGTLTAARSDSYGAVVPGVELKILWLVEEGTLVAPGDRLIHFDPAPFQRERDTAYARVRELQGEADQARLALEALRLRAGMDLQEKKSSAEISERELGALVNTKVPLSAKESAHEVEQRERLLTEAETKLGGLEPFVAEGYISQDEFRAAQARRDQAAADLRLARARHSALVHQTNPDLIARKTEEAETDRIQLQVGQEKTRVDLGQAEAASRVSAARLEEATRQKNEAEKKIAACSVAANAPGLAVHTEVFDKGGERRKVRVGDSVWGGTTVVTLPDLSRMLVEGRVPESEIHRLSPGQKARVRLDAFPGLALTGLLRSIGSVGASERNESRSFPVTIALDQTNPRFRPGMIARCSVACGRAENVLYIPIEAVRSDDRGVHALVVPGIGKPSRRPLQLGASTSQFVEVKAGLKEGETVRVGGE